MSFLLSTFVERWRSRARVRTESPTVSDLESSITQVEQLILMSASPIAELDPASGAPSDEVAVFFGDVSSSPMREIELREESEGVLAATQTSLDAAVSLS